MNKRTFLAALLAATTLGANAAQKPMNAPKGGKAISDELIGIFFEDISSSADGGLFAELLQNGSFEFSPAERDGWGPGTAWKTIRPGHSLGYIQPSTKIVDDKSFTSPYNSNTCMRLHVERSKEFYDYKGWKGFGLQNDGFDGISVKNGAKYDFSMRLANVDGAKQVRVESLNIWQKPFSTSQPAKASIGRTILQRSHLRPTARKLRCRCWCSTRAMSMLMICRSCLRIPTRATACAKTWLRLWLTCIPGSCVSPVAA